MSKFDEMRQAVSEAKITLQAADAVADDLARMLVGRLHHVKSRYVLERLKRELKNFNMRTGNFE